MLMITGRAEDWKKRCAAFGVDVEAFMQCVVEDRGKHWVVDDSHPIYARFKATQPPGGPGTELTELLALAGVVAQRGCKCKERAREMDDNEFRQPGWCEANIETIVGWLREEATKRKLPFVDVAGRLLVKRAIRNARRAAS
jgi:hypothetical protein